LHPLVKSLCIRYALIHNENVNHKIKKEKFIFVKFGGTSPYGMTPINASSQMQNEPQCNL